MFGSRISATTIAAAIIASLPARPRRSGVMPPPKFMVRLWIDSIDRLRVALGADQVAVFQAHHLVLVVRSVGRAHSLGGGRYPPAVLGLREPRPERREVAHSQVEEGGHRRDQRDEEHALEND